MENTRFEQHKFVAKHGSAIPYNLLRPEKIQPGKSPLLLFLHGAGERGIDNQSHLKHGLNVFLAAASTYDSFVLIPQCPKDQLWTQYDHNAPVLKLFFTPDRALLNVVELLKDLCSSNPIDFKRLYVMGISMGGFGTWTLAQRYASLFAAIVPICGGGDPALADHVKDTPVWAFHGDEDNAVSVRYSRIIIDSIKTCGGQPRYTEYPGIGHDSWNNAFADPELLPWLFAQINPRQPELPK